LPPARPNEPNDQKPELPEKIASLLEVVPEPQRAALVSSLLEQFELVTETTSMMARMTHFSGPYPHPDILRGMEEVVKGSAAQVINMAVDQSTHRREIEKIVVKSQTRQSAIGQVLGFIIAIVGLTLSGFLIYKGHDLAGGVLGTADIAALVSIFVIGKRSQMQELQEKKPS
jgi:uncharacterized membrane protein